MSSTSTEEFESAMTRVKKLPKQPNDVLLELYGLFKQASEGDVHGKRPGMLDVRGRAKYDAWAQKKGMSSEDAQRAYVDLVNKLEAEAS